MVASTEFIDWGRAVEDRQMVSGELENKFEHSHGPIDLRAYLHTRPQERFAELTQTPYDPSPTKDGRPAWYPMESQPLEDTANNGIIAYAHEDDVKQKFDLMDDTLLDEFDSPAPSSKGPRSASPHNSKLTSPHSVDHRPRRDRQNSYDDLDDLSTSRSSASIEDIPPSVFESSSADENSGDESSSSSDDDNHSNNIGSGTNNAWPSQSATGPRDQRSPARQQPDQNNNDVAATPSDESDDDVPQGITQEQLTMLYRGHVFRKHGEQGSPNPRFVWLDSQHNCFRWCDPRKSADAMRSEPAARQSIYVDSVSHVQRGRTTAVFLRTSKKISTTELADLPCFSIILKRVPPTVPGASNPPNRPRVTLTKGGKAKLSLDLQAENQTVRDAWASAIEALLRDGDYAENQKRPPANRAPANNSQDENASARKPNSARPASLPLQPIDSTQTRPAPVSRNLAQDFANNRHEAQRPSTAPQSSSRYPHDASEAWDGRKSLPRRRGTVQPPNNGRRSTMRGEYSTVAV